MQYYGNNCYGDTAVVTCDNGYGISEPASGSSVTITCTADGTWSEAVPTCAGMDISNPLRAAKGSKVLFVLSLLLEYCSTVKY